MRVEAKIRQAGVGLGRFQPSGIPRVVGRVGGKLIRINPREPEVPSRHVGLPLSAADGIRRICRCAENLVIDDKSARYGH